MTEFEKSKSRQETETTIRRRVRRSGIMQLGLLGASVVLGITSAMNAKNSDEQLGWTLLTGEGGVLIAAGTERGMAVRRIKRAVADFAIADGRLGSSHNDARTRTILKIEDGELFEDQVYDEKADPNRAMKASSAFSSDKVAELKRAAMSSGYNFLAWTGGVFVGAGLGSEEASDKGALLGSGGVTTVAVLGMGVAGVMFDNSMLTRGYIQQLDNIEGNYSIGSD